MSSSSFWRFDSALIYLFGGIAAMLGLIVIALAILACSQRNRQSTPAAHDSETGKGIMKHLQSNNSPKFVVVMAGDKIPTYVAAPAGVN
ncbi:hypothetical protein QVD17_04762 [Tagetes erecta]|uniref:Uncharacterized protein n=1 Tax=Tagetes erecta TaxID=13708 RepID=A0AAD8PAM9_TARER|nr:hypothetical protein QVD17_04762 [Tagetes erecta]